MGVYVFRDSTSLSGFYAQTRLGTRVLNALGEIVSSGTPIAYDADQIVEADDDFGARVEIDLQWDRERIDWHRNDGAAVLEKHGISVESFPERAD